MKFRKFGKMLLMSALSAGLVIGISSCKQSYSVGFLYVTGNQTASTTGQGIISGFKIDHNTGNLTAIVGLPVSTGGANPVRAWLLTGGRFLYVLNRGTTTDGGPCSPTDVCSNANITQFSIGGNGILAPQGTYYTQGHNPFRLIADSQGSHLYVLDHDAPSGAGCALVFGQQVTTCGDITAFSIDATTGRLSYLLNSQVTSASGAPLPYFPVPANPIDFALASNYFLTLSGTPTTPGGDTVFPYAYNNSSGQLTVNQNTSQPLNIAQGTAIVAAGGEIYVLDDGPQQQSAADEWTNLCFQARNQRIAAGRGGWIYSRRPNLLLPELRVRGKRQTICLHPESGRQCQHHQCAEWHRFIQVAQPFPIATDLRSNWIDRWHRRRVRSALSKTHPISSFTPPISTVPRSQVCQLTKTPAI